MKVEELIKKLEALDLPFATVKVWAFSNVHGEESLPPEINVFTDPEQGVTVYLDGDYDGQ